MVDNICKRWEAWQDIQSGGQVSFIAEDPNNHTVTPEDIEQYTMEHFQQCKNWTFLYDALAIFFMKYGPLCSTGSVKKVLKDLEKKGMLQVLRNPEYTSNGKRKSMFMSEEKNQRVSVRWSQ